MLPTTLVTFEIWSSSLLVTHRLVAKTKPESLQDLIERQGPLDDRTKCTPLFTSTYYITVPLTQNPLRRPTALIPRRSSLRYNHDQCPNHYQRQCQIRAGMAGQSTASSRLARKLELGGVFVGSWYYYYYYRGSAITIADEYSNQIDCGVSNDKLGVWA